MNAFHLHNDQKRSTFFDTILPAGQGLYFMATGIWPILNRRSFEAVTGPKTDFWIVRTVGGLITVVGAIITLAGLRRRVTPEISLLAVGSAASLTASDVVYTAKRRIHPIYLLDAITEVGLMILWALRWVR